MYTPLRNISEQGQVNQTNYSRHPWDILAIYCSRLLYVTHQFVFYLIIKYIVYNCATCIRLKSLPPLWHFTWSQSVIVIQVRDWPCSPPAWHSCFQVYSSVIARQQWGHGGIWLACVLILLDHRKKHVVLSNVQAFLDCDYTVLKCFFSLGTFFFSLVYFSLLMNPDGHSLFQFAAPIHNTLPYGTLIEEVLLKF